ncbi:MAG: COX15/CtaA family protein [Gammaproteobacteria bacterium]|nr:COX15/CtaA family protein [Gammaproteobacteria bacterium]
MFTNITRLSVVLAFIVVVLGAYVRLSGAGLACPDWPGCYGELIVPEETYRSEHLYPNQPLEHDKAWKEMIHRYTAGSLGILIVCLAIMAWKQRSVSDQPVLIPLVLVLLVIFQALLGMWTVTLLLKPVIVVGHLLVGMAILSLLFWVLLGQLNKGQVVDRNAARFFPWTVAGLFIIAIQISLGGWTSANYAALICPDFPTCQGIWWPPMDFVEGFTFWRETGIDYEGGILAGDARTAIHMSHRIGALVTLMIIGTIAIQAMRNSSKIIARIGMVMLLVLLVQISLGITNVTRLLPLPAAVAHNGAAALLLLSLVTLLHYSFSTKTNVGESVE